MRTCAFFAAIAFALSAGIGTAQDFPAKPLKFVMPYSVAGASDAAGRLMAERWRDTFRWSSSRLPRSHRI